MKKNILNELGKRIVFFDGGMGTLLQERGLEAGELPENWNLKHPDIIRELHRDYLNAGADIILANTFGANELKFPDNLEEIVTKGVQNAKKAVEETGKDGYVALDVGPTGKLLKPLGTLDFEDAVSIFARTIKAGAAAGADLILIETMSDTYELKAAMLAAKENSDLPVMATVIFGENGKMLTGATPDAVTALLEGLGADAFGMNCGLGPKQMKPIFERLAKSASIPLIINPNAGLPRSENGKTVYDVDPKDFAAVMEEIVRMGAVITGGCCGTTPDHIHAMVELTKDIPVQMPEKKHRTVISSYSQAVVFDKKTIIIGERINPTGKSKFKQALRDHNLEYILREGVTQQDNGADVLDVNVGLPEIDEPSMMEDVVKELQAVIDLPLQLDTSSAEAMERGLRVYNGKPLIDQIQVGIHKGEIVTLIGPNGSGKSTILKSITRQLKILGGKVLYEENDLHKLSYKELSTRMAVVLTERMRPELMTCHDIVATGRYPYTGRLGILSREDEDKVDEAMRIVHAEELGSRDFNAISDGQRQRVLLARAICQEPEIIVLDEPTSFLDIRHKLELLSILRSMAKEKGITVIMSLHEIDLAQKIADQILCVKGDHVCYYGTPEQIFEEQTIRELYGIENGFYDPRFGSIELPKVEGEPEVFVIAGCGRGIPIYRKLQKDNIPFATGILYTNDVDYQLARLLAARVITEEPFCQITQEHLREAIQVMEKCKKVICADVPIGECNKGLEELIRAAKKKS